jgi:predicted GH43/DUF377 family glycosyl hydrolase
MMDVEDIFTRYDLALRPDAARTVLRPFTPSDPASFQREPRREQRLVQAILELDEEGLTRAYEAIVGWLRDRHRDVEAYLDDRFRQLQREIGLPPLCGARAALIGAYFTEEYAFQSAALFNPTCIIMSNQSNVPDGATRLLFALRGIGEGHVSSVTFRVGTWKPGFAPEFELPSSRCMQARVDEADGEVVRFAWPELDNISDAVLFPVTPSQRQGIEDLRLTLLRDEDGSNELYGTYTAFSGSSARPEMLHSRDRKCFDLRPLTGMYALNKGMALFPRRVEGRYVMLGRADSESIWLLRSDELYRWDEGQRLAKPRFGWELVQMGNCGPPIEIDEGWLVLTHGVGALRTYSIGALLLDKTDPARVLARTPKPLLTPRPEERDGYVPNVVYSCGGSVVDRTLLLPYAVADQYTAFASAPVEDVLASMH